MREGTGTDGKGMRRNIRGKGLYACGWSKEPEGQLFTKYSAGRRPSRKPHLTACEAPSGARKSRPLNSLRPGSLSSRASENGRGACKRAAAPGRSAPGPLPLLVPAKQRRSPQGLLIAMPRGSKISVESRPEPLSRKHTLFSHHGTGQ